MSTPKQGVWQSREGLSQPSRSWFNPATRLRSALFLLMVFGVEVAVGAWMIRDVRTADVEVQRMYSGSVIGLRSIGELQYEAQETRRSTLYALTTNDGNLQVHYVDQSREADRRVGAGIDHYVEQARSAREIELGKSLISDWRAYLRVRDEVLALTLEGGTKEAVALDLREGVLSFERVRRDLEDILRLYDEQAARGLTAVSGSSHRTVLKLIAVFVFVLLFSSVSVWAVDRSRVLAALHMAELQMDFVASVSHDLRTPLAAILCASQNITDGFAPNLQLYGSMITTQALQLIDLVDQVLMFASMKGVKKNYPLQPLQVPDLFEDIRKSSLWMFEQEGFTVNFTVQEGMPCALGDLKALSRCLQNLIANATKYSRESRWVGVHAELHESKGSRKEIRISVQDRGMGISPSEFRHIFEPFYRSPRVRSAQIRGTGLGLSVAKQIAEAMGGRVSMVSEVGVGSVFTLHLRVADALNPAAVAGKQDAVILR